MKRCFKLFGISGLILITACSNSDKTAAEVQPIAKTKAEVQSTAKTEVANCKQGGACQVGEFGDGQWFGGQVILVDGSDSTNYLQHGIDMSSDLYGGSMISGENTMFQIPVPWCRFDPVVMPPELTTSEDGVGNTSKLIGNCLRTEEDFNNSYGSASSAIFKMNHQGSGVNWETTVPWSSWGTTASWYVPTRQELLNIFESYRTNRYVFDIELANGCYWTSERSSTDAAMYAVEYTKDSQEAKELPDIARCLVIPVRKNPYRDQVTVAANNRSSSTSIPTESATTTVKVDDVSDQLNFSTEVKQRWIRFGTEVWAIAASRDGKFALVAHPQSNTVSKIDLSNNSVIATINVDNSPRSIAIDPEGKFAYVVTRGSRVAKINLSIDMVIANIEVGEDTSKIVIDNVGKFAYTVGWNPSYVSQIDLQSGVMTSKYRLNGSSVTIDPSGAFLYVMNTRNFTETIRLGLISKIDLKSGKLVASIETNGKPECMVINREGTYAYVNLSWGVVKIDLQTNTEVKEIRISTSSTPSTECLFINPLKTFIYVPDSDNNTVSEINLENDEVKVISALQGLRMITFDPNGKFAYAIGDNSRFVTIGK